MKPTLTKQQIETIRMWLDRRGILDAELQILCDMAEETRKSREADHFARDLCQALNEGDGSYKP